MLRVEILTKMKALHAKMDTASGDDLASMAADFNALSVEVNKLDAEAARTAHAALITEETKKEMADRALWDVFGKLMRSEQVDDVARDALSVRHPTLWKNGHKDDFRAPGDALAYLCPPPALPEAARETYVDSGDSGPLPLMTRKTSPLVQMPLPPTPLWDRGNKITAINGIGVPILTQTSANPWGGIVVSIGEEADAKVDAGYPLIGKETITTHEFNGYCLVKNLALLRAPTYAGLIQDMFVGAIASRANLEGIVGDGTTEPEGILIAAGVLEIPRDTANEVNWVDLVGLEEAAPWYWTAGARFMISQGVREFLKSDLAVEDGRPLFTGSTAEGIWSRLVGREYNLDFCSALGTRGDVIFGDPRWYMWAVEQDIVFRSTDQGFALSQQNATMFIVHAHIGGQLLEPAVFSVLDDVATTEAATTAA